ncbi:MAG: heparinase II/III family protein [Planctomycetes bacterium]|nr:heparinase II/III family protein [Planctomycetota bacterium]
MTIESIDVHEAILNSQHQHPRLLYTQDAIDDIKQRIDKSSFHSSMADFIITTARELLSLLPMQRIVEGSRLLAVSRHYLKRIHFLSLAFHLTGERVFVDKAQEEMLSAVAFSDWNPSHMLDVGEMCTAIALGYDLLFHELDDAACLQIRDGIKTLGLEAMDIDSFWVEGSTNWNPVCHGGCIMGALAIMDDEPELAEKVITRAIKNVPLALAAYEPEGAHPEGPMYWGYGTGYAVVLIAALESALGSDFGLLNNKGFRQTGSYFLQATGTSGYYFNYADCRLDAEVTPAIFWFADRFNNPSVVWNQVPLFKEFLQKEEPAIDRTGYEKHLHNDQLRLFPLVLLWAKDVDALVAPTESSCAYSGETPVSILRTGWSANDAYVGIKAGSPSGPHGHMDVGSFIYDNLGERWVHDLGLEEYHSVESKGIVLWEKAQDGGRWTVNRLSNHLHNTLVINGGLQKVDAQTSITRFSEDAHASRAQIDMTTAYQPALQSSKRGFSLLADASLIIRDEVLVGDEVIQLRWAMLTFAEIEIISAHCAVLRQNGEELYIDVQSESSVAWEIIDSATAVNDWDSENADSRMLGFTVQVAAKSQVSFTVHIRQPSQDIQAIDNLDQWPVT